MATYKLIQDIEAEDKILGPLTLRQFIFALIAAFLLYICFFLVTKHAAFLLVLFLPPALFFLFFAMPFGRDQPTEIWALAKLRYYFKPRNRIWSQDGVKELVKITVPKRVERVLTNGLSQNEVQSRLNALATTIDSRGWAVKNVNVNSYMPQAGMVSSSDRLLDISSIPQAVPDSDITASDDILDARSNPIAQQFDSMISRSAQQHRQELLDQMNAVAAPVEQQAPNWFMEQPAAQAAATVAETQDETSWGAELHHQAAQPSPVGNLRTLQPMPAAPTPTAQAASPVVTAPTDPAILSLANNDDMNVATLAREAQKAMGDDPSQGEVTVPLR